ncbi:MAG: hypothetical protein ACREH9_05835 [Pseudomonadota bacterium]
MRRITQAAGSAIESRTRAAAKRGSERSPLVAAYCEGLGLGAVAVIGEAGEVRIEAAAACATSGEAEKNAVARFWCSNAADAGRVAAAAARRFAREEKEGGESKDAVARACAAVSCAASRLAVALLSEQAIAAEAAALICRIDAELEKLKRSGALHAVNKAYRDYRINASARGEAVLRYADWMRRYREGLVRDAAAALRYL